MEGTTKLASSTALLRDLAFVDLDRLVCREVANLVWLEDEAGGCIVIVRVWEIDIGVEVRGVAYLSRDISCLWVPDGS